MSNELFIKIIGAVITILCALITSFLVPWLKSKLNQTQLEKLDFYVNLAVRSANQIFSADQWESKKMYVTAYVTDVINTKLHLTLTPEDIDVMIEGIVNQVKKEQ